MSCQRWRCIPALDVDDVVHILEEQGFDCDSTTLGSHFCNLQFGNHHYRVHISTYELISHYTVEVSHPQRLVTPRVHAVLGWFATLPFSADPDAATAIRQWTSEHLDGVEDQTATVRGYDFALTLTEPTRVTLTLDIKDR